MKYDLPADWYLKAYTLEMVNQAWTKTTVEDVDFIWEALQLTAGMTLLDIACGFGRHSIEFAKRGIKTTAVDISPELILYAKNQSNQTGVSIDWICNDIRSIDWKQGFDVVLNLYDGAIGYGQTDTDNELLFAAVARALRKGGKHLMHIPNYEYVIRRFPQKSWRSTESHIEIIDLELDTSTNYMFESTSIIEFGKVFTGLSPVLERKRVYSIKELEDIWSKIGLSIINVTGGFTDRKSDFIRENDDYIVIQSIKK